jgi:hypothetical protein
LRFFCGNIRKKFMVTKLGRNKKPAAKPQVFRGRLGEAS